MLFSPPLNLVISVDKSPSLATLDYFPDFLYSHTNICPAKSIIISMIALVLPFNFNSSSGFQ